MAKTATKTSSSKGGKTKATSKSKTRSSSSSKERTGKRSGSGKPSSSDMTAADALVKLIESPLVADLLAVGATAALAAIAETRFGRGDDKSRATKTLKVAAKAAAAAMGRRLANEVDEIRKAAEKAKADEAS